MARLNDSQKTYIVQRLACYAGAAVVRKEVKELWEIDVSLQRIAHYDPGVPSTKTPKKWEDLHAATREAYLKAKAEVGIASERWRMERRQVLYERAEGMGQSGNIPLCLQILEQAEKAEGGAFTNRHKMDLAGEIKGGVLVVPAGGDPDAWASSARSQQRAVANGASGTRG